MRRIVFFLFTLPLAIILIALSVANRSAVVATLDPFNPGNPALSAEVPLFVLVLGALLIGAIIGALLTWLSQGRYRAKARTETSRAEAIRKEAEALKQERASLLKEANSNQQTLTTLPAMRG
jgi:uncharacterized integral membrane protein